MKAIAGDFHDAGYLILESADLRQRMGKIADKFLAQYASRFTDDASRNRNLIKLLAENIELKRFFCSDDIVAALTQQLGFLEPVQTGPIVTHYTASDVTGNNYGLPYHQDWPSMGTSTKGVIVWTSISPVGKQGPGLRIVPGSQSLGLWAGSQTDVGYVLEQQEIDGYLDIEVQPGQILVMSPYLVHRTRTSSAGGWKLSLSCRFDDLECASWDRRNFVSAYKTAVDRNTYLVP